MRTSDKLWIDLAPLRKLSAARFRAWRDRLQPSDEWLAHFWEQRWIAGQSEAYTVSAALRPTLVVRCFKCKRESFAGYTEEMEAKETAFTVLAKQLEQEAATALVKRGCKCAEELAQGDPDAFDISVSMILLANPDIDEQ